MAASVRTIAVIGFDALQLYSITELIRRENDYIILDTLDEQCDIDAIDAFIITPSEFVSRFDLFLTKRAKTLILADKVSSVGIDMSVSVVAINSGLGEIEEAISVLLNSAECGAISNSELSARERDVLKEIASGKIIKEVADTLNISVNTVLTHRKNISAKLGIRSVSGLSVYALMNGIIK